MVLQEPARRGQPNASPQSESDQESLAYQLGDPAARGCRTNPDQLLTNRPTQPTLSLLVGSVTVEFVQERTGVLLEALTLVLLYWKDWKNRLKLTDRRPESLRINWLGGTTKLCHIANCADGNLVAVAADGVDVAEVIVDVVSRWPYPTNTPEGLMTAALYRSTALNMGGSADLHLPPHGDLHWYPYRALTSH
jgi:hypothetical protein